MSEFENRIAPSEAEHIWQLANRSGLLTEATRTLIVHDLRRMRSRIAELRDCFPSRTLHALAIKANPVVEVLREAVRAGAGLEAASLEEVHLALAAGCPAERVVFDSPAKTRQEIREALQLGILINADNLDELSRIDQALRTRGSESSIGLRINPEVGAGTISHTSVGHTGSKFGVSLSTFREEIVSAFCRYDWLCGLHMHVGSQGCDLELLTEAAARLQDLGSEVETAANRRLGFVDIGGGLPTLYRQQDQPTTPAGYLQKLQGEAGQLLQSRKLITEFGRAIQAGCGLTLSRVEYIRPEQQMAVIHVGADLLLRPVYRPDDWSHEFFVLDQHGRLKSGPRAPLTITGPLCFSGDVLARHLSLPQVEEGDWIGIRDTGAYTLSMWSRHCSRAIPSVVGYDSDASHPMRLLKPAETPDDLVRFWGLPFGSAAGNKNRTAASSCVDS